MFLHLIVAIIKKMAGVDSGGGSISLVFVEIIKSVWGGGKGDIRVPLRGETNMVCATPGTILEVFCDEVTFQEILKS